MEKIDFTKRAISTSALLEAKASTRKFLYYYSKDKTTKNYLDFGNAAELYLIDKPAFFEKVYVFDESKRPFPDKNYQTKANADWKRDQYEQNADKYVIPSSGSDSFEMILAFEKLLLNHPAYDLITGKKYQAPFTWICPVTGYKRYSRCDLYGDGVIVEIKTDQDEDFARTCVKHDYFFKAFDQIQGAILSGVMPEVKEYYFLVLSKSNPLYIDFYKLEIDSMLRVEEAYNSTLLRLKEDLQNPDIYDTVYQNYPLHKLTVPNYYK